jgi:predicted MFS family arabinose efflux permease
VLRSDAGCRAAVQAVALTSLTVSPFIALVPSMAQLVFHGGAVDTAHFVVAQGVGAVLGALSMSALVRRFGKQQMIRLWMFVLPVVEGAYALSPSRWVAMVMLSVLGFVYLNVMVNLSTLLQLRAPAPLRARAISAFFTTLGLLYAVGAMVQGWLGDVVGIRQVHFLGAAVMLVAVAALAVFRRRWFSSLDAPEATPDPPSAEVAEVVEVVDVATGAATTVDVMTTCDAGRRGAADERCRQS